MTKKKKTWGLKGKHPPLWLLIILCLITIGLVGYLLVIFFGDRSWFTALAYLIAASAIASGGCVAYHHLRILQGTERAAVLARLDACWLDNELASSRREFLKFIRGLKSKKDSPKLQREIITKLAAYRENRPNLYRKLVAMLDFYETVGYFSRVQYILPRDARQLYESSIKQYDKYFREFIAYFQKDQKDDAIYENFIWLADEIAKS